MKVSKSVEKVAHLLPVSVLTKKQVKTFSKENVTINGELWRKIEVRIRYDDECGNGKNSFSVTGSAWYPRNLKANDPDTCGCIHELIAAAFPEFEYLIKWHLVSSDAPMYYVENTVYHAADKLNGFAKGEPCQFEKVYQFGDFPITFKLKKAFADFILGLTNFDMLEIVPVDYVKKTGSDYDFDPKFTFSGFTCEWHSSPFDTRTEADQFLKALQNYELTEKTIVTKYSKGKTPDLDAARRCAKWDKATLDQLTDEDQLLERLPKLMQEFKKDVESLGFVY